MRLLDRYLLRELTVPLLLCLGGFLVFWVSFDLFTMLSVFQEARSTAAEVAEFYLVKIPEFLVLIMPIGLLLALLYALTKHSRHHEIIAIRAAGWSIWRIAAPYLAVGLLFTGIAFALNEELVPNSMDQGQEILGRHRGEAEIAKAWKTKINFRNARDGRTWNIGAYNLDTFEMRDPHVEWNPANGARRQLMARGASRTNGTWVFQDAHMFTYDPRVQATNNEPPPAARSKTLSLPELTETPEDIKILIKFSRMSSIDASKKPQLSLAEIRYLTTHLELNRRDRALIETQWHARLAQPWTCLVVVLLAFSFGVTSGRKNVFVGVAASIFICFAYFILLRTGLALGTGGLMPPWLAAWAPNLLFGGSGLFLMRRVI